MDDNTTCHNGHTCPGWNGKQAAPTDQPFCHNCLDRASRDIRALVYDYLDLAQLHEASLSQAPDEHTTGGGHESPTLLADHVEALQAEILWVAATWEHALRARQQLSNPRTYTPLWRTTVYDHLRLTDRQPVLVKARPGAIVQRAISIITGRLDQLARLEPITVCPTGIEDEPTVMHGWEAIHQLQNLHTRARATLGRTTRRFWIPGECWHCDARPTRDVDGPLYRSEPRRHEDPMEVHCQPCGATRPYADYETYMTSLLWPGQDTDANVRIAA
ncbi:hypothetical protein FHR83_006689 [Actinoplanes campanulatus]|uniref:Uncharacterized protein n=1 Tax=Actinoplanes campanulatus TaxID=113559 RepID=A0A7W5AMG2_9ACTN|nr:hypothetical protein [Actinoplanes campanulatus]MBB3098983.1 hypothetical protein [Actinoplanes campanulatus]GGN39572.1 hypothetical protein GCM10010109_67670 [Actinoplanes campanulatus]